jgi:poly(3-hydroxybutyrate) depolymerase
MRMSSAAAAALVAAALAARADGLPRLVIAPHALTVSGVSSGGYMATQFQLSFSRVVHGIGVFAAGPWDCARGSLARAFGECLGRPDGAPDAPALIVLARAAASAGDIDPVESLADARVWIFHGTRDATVAPSVTRALADFYRGFVAAPNLRYLEEVAVGHGIPTEAAGAPCDATAPPFLYACHYDAVGAMLAFLYGAAPAAPAGARGSLTSFDQSPYDPTGSLAPRGYLYVPHACTGRQPCRLHVAFHGCRQGVEFVGETFVRDAGYNGWADAHGLVVLYPQVKRSHLLPLNPEGCWDWWGYTGEHYATRDGRQVAAVRAMVRALAGF